jgi:hypothetical protein
MLQTQNAASTPVAPYKVDAFAGERNSEVSKQWMSRPIDQRFLSLDAMYDKAKAEFDASFETRCASRDVDLIAPIPKTREDMHKLTIGVKIDTPLVQEVREVAPTHWAFGQLCQRARAPASFLREIPSQLSVDVLNYRLKHDREVEEIKLFGGPEELYAATGPTYGRIGDFEVIEAVRQVAGSGRGERRWKVPGVMNWRDMTYDPEAPVTLDSTTLYRSDRDLFIFLVDDRNPIEVGKTKSGEPDLMFRGFYLQNSQVGSRSMKLAGFYLRGVCMNRNLWGVEGFQEITIRHTRLAPERWLQQCLPALNSYADGSSQRLIDGVARAKEAMLVDSKEEALDFLKTRGFSSAAVDAILTTGEEEEGRPVRSAWDFGQAITAFARTIPNTDDRLQAELEAKKVLDKAVGVRPAAIWREAAAEIPKAMAQTASLRNAY